MCCVVFDVRMRSYGPQAATGTLRRVRLEDGCEAAARGRPRGHVARPVLPARRPPTDPRRRGGQIRWRSGRVAMSGGGDEARDGALVYGRLRVYYCPYLLAPQV